MATSGSFQSNNEKYCNLYVEWKVTGQSVANNTSTVQVDVYLKHHALNIPSKTLTINFGSTVKNITTPAINIGSSANTTKLGSATLTAWHNANGTKSLTISVSMPIGAYCDGTYFESVTASGSATFNQIARPTTPTLSASTVELGQTVTVNTPRNLGELTHTLTYSIGSASGSIGNSGSSRTWTPSIDLAHQITKSTSGIAVITCKTYSGSTLIGTRTVNITLTVPSSIIPSIKTFEVEDAKGCLTKYGNFVQNHSEYKVTIDANLAYSSPVATWTIDAYTASFMTKTASGTYDAGTPYGSGEQTIWVQVKDARGRTRAAQKDFIVLAYSKPTAIISAHRCNANGNENPEGAYIKATISGSITALNNKNSKTYKIQYKTANDDESAFETNTPLTDTSAYELTTSAIFPADVDTVYNVRAIATDDFGTAVHTIDVSTAYTIIDFKADGTGIAFGKASTEEGFDVDMKALFRQGIKSNLTTGTYLAGNQGKAIIDSTATAGGYTALAKLNSTNGFFTTAVHNTNLRINYTAKETVDAGTNSVTKQWILSESGNTQIPGVLYPGNQSLYYVSSGTSKLNELQCNGDVTAHLGSTTQCSLIGVNERINKLLPHPYTLIQAKTATTTATTHTLLYERKFTDYGLLTITIGTHQTDIRESMTVPMWLFYKPTPVNGVNTVNAFTLTCLASNGATNSVKIKYISDTQVSIQLLTSGTDANIVNIYGVKTDDVPH